MTVSVVALVAAFAVFNVLVVVWSQWMQGRRMNQLHHRLDILSKDLGKVQAEQRDIEGRVSVGEQERRWQEELRKVTEKF